MSRPCLKAVPGQKPIAGANPRYDDFPSLGFTDVMGKCHLRGYLSRCTHEQMSCGQKLSLTASCTARAASVALICPNCVVLNAVAGGLKFARLSRLKASARSIRRARSRSTNDLARDISHWARPGPRFSGRNRPALPYVYCGGLTNAAGSI